MGLRTRFLIVILAVYVAALAATLLAFSQIVSRVAGNLGAAYARQYALASRAVLQEPLAREITLVLQLAQSPTVRAWVRDEQDETARRLAFEELEGYRARLSTGSWFYIVDSSLRYYYDDAAHRWGEQKLAYTLDRKAGKDAWYFATLDQVPEYALNVNYDEVLAVRRVWINVVVREPDGRPLGVAGTGIDLSRFLEDFIDTAERGVECIVLDSRLAIQAHVNPSLIDEHSLAREASDRSTIARLVGEREDLERLEAALARLRGGSRSETIQANVGGQERLIGATYLATLDWYVLTTLDLDMLIERTLYAPMAFLAVISLLLIAGAVGWAVNRMVLTPLSSVTAAARRLADGDLEPDPPSSRADEIGTLSRAFYVMAASVRRITAELESRVRDRTAALDDSNRKLADLVRALEEAAITDSLTGLLNRRGMLARIRPEVDRVGRRNSTLAFFMIDLDHFKHINDTHGHEAGDRVLAEVAGRYAGPSGPTITARAGEERSSWSPLRASAWPTRRASRRSCAKSSWRSACARGPGMSA